MVGVHSDNEIARSSTLATVFLLCLLSTLAFAALDFPALTGRVVDQANIIPAASKSALDSKLQTLEDKSGIQLVVATVKSLQGGDIETYANQLFRAWKLGEAKKNNGVLLLIAPSEHKVRIEVGYGLEGTLTDALSSVIIASAIVPRFKANDFPGGIERGVDGIIAVLTTDAADWHEKVRVRNDDPMNGLVAILPFFFLFVLIVFLFLVMKNINTTPSGHMVNRNGRMVYVPNSGSAWGSGWSSGGGGFSSGGGFGGGFSGGGGSSGGGGASGGW
jgi:uncharacterized protein